MLVLGLSSKREVTRTSIRVRTAMALKTRDQARYLGGRPMPVPTRTRRAARMAAAVPNVRNVNSLNP